MGTSTSSSGPGGGVPFDPPWLEQSEGNGDSDTAATQSDAPVEPPINPAENIAPPGRFFSARRSIGKFAREGGGRENFNKAAGHYSKKGMGGAGRVATRMGHSTKTAARLASFLGTAHSGADPAIVKWVQEVSSLNLSPQEIIDEIIRHVSPDMGAKDEESGRDSMAQAMSDFLENHEDQDLLNLEEAEIREITELFIGNEAYNRLVNDIGQIFERAQVAPSESIKVCQEMREYLTADISVQIQNLWEENSNPTQSQLDQLLKNAIENTFNVYEDGI